MNEWMDESMGQERVSMAEAGHAEEPCGRISGISSPRGESRRKAKGEHLMPYEKAELLTVLRQTDLGNSVAELDGLLEIARVETSAFTDLFEDRVDLIPGTKGSGKSALYRIFVDFLSKVILKSRKVVVAHGVQSHGDSVFLLFNDRFSKLNEDAFVDFWCIYLISLAHEHFLKSDVYAEYLVNCKGEIEKFKRSCEKARVPEIKAKKSLRDVLDWALNATMSLRPKLSYSPDGESSITLDLFGGRESPREEDSRDHISELPQYMSDIKESLEAILTKADLQLWLMVDRLDEIFPRRSSLETRALRGLLRTLRIFTSDRIRIKLFLRDDILTQVTSGGEGFTALSHITARQADTLDWSEDQILTLIVNRLFVPGLLRDYVGVNPEKLKASKAYRGECFYKVFTEKVHSGPNQSPTLRWIYNHAMDGNGVVTPRDVIDLLTRAKQRQQDEFGADASGRSDWIIGPAAIQYGLSELSKRKRETYLQAEFPHFWDDIKKFARGKTEYTCRAMEEMLGSNWAKKAEDLVSIGVFKEIRYEGDRVFQVPFLYRSGLELTQGRMD
jgi:hypothetical protein